MYNEGDLDVDLSRSWKFLLGHHTPNMLCAEQPFITKFSNYARPCTTVRPDDYIGQLQSSLLLNTCMSSTPLREICSCYRVVQEKTTIILQPFAVESCGFHQSAQQLTGNAKNWQILNLVIKYSFLAAL